ncbi:hypothetical protein KY330_05765, partial [Candidatus Woesearchaeota archaeon]|nr:hypothetical protein [Candidatus Woesearchaeota archaeon]
DRGKRPEAVESIDVVVDDRIKRIIDMYKNDEREYAGRVGTYDDLPVLDKNLVAVAVNLLEDIPNEIYRKFGCYVNQMIGDSFYAGNNDFHIMISNKAESLCSWLSGTHENRLKISVYGDVGNSFAESSKYCNIIVHGDCGSYFAFGANNCDIEVHGDLREFWCDGSTHCSFFIDGLVVVDNFYYHEPFGSSFKTTNPETFNRFNMKFRRCLNRFKVEYIEPST